LVAREHGREPNGKLGKEIQEASFQAREGWA